MLYILASPLLVSLFASLFYSRSLTRAAEMPANQYHIRRHFGPSGRRTVATRRWCYSRRRWRCCPREKPLQLRRQDLPVCLTAWRLLFREFHEYGQCLAGYVAFREDYKPLQGVDMHRLSCWMAGQPAGPPRRIVGTT